MQHYNVVLEDGDGNIHTTGCMCGSKYEASRVASTEVEENEKLKEKGFLVIDIKMVSEEDTVEYVDTNTLTDILEGDKDNG